MTKKQKGTFWVLFGLSLAFLLIYIVPDMQGAANPEMLSIFQSDEFAQYPYVLHMLNGGSTILQVIHTFLVYGHYYYGYPFYFFSGLALIPLKLILGTNWTANTPLIVMVLRETINVLPMLLAILLLVWMQTHFRSLWKSLLLFLFLETVSAVVANNLWWHPDSLLVLFCVLTLFFLQRDRLRFGIDFYLSGVACALAIGAKTLGVLFVTTYLVYLVYGLITRKIRFWRAVKVALLYLLVMVGTIVLSNPQLLMPIERSEIIAVFKSNLSENTQGFWIISGGLAQNWSTFTGYIRSYYADWWIFIPALACLIAGIAVKRTRLNALLVFAWIVTYCGYFIFIAATLRPHYFLPVLLPLYSSLALFWPEERHWSWPKPKADILPWINALSVLLLLVALIFNLIKMVGQLSGFMNEVTNSTSVQFFDQVDQEYLTKLPTDKNFTFYRDWRAYIAPQKNWTLIMDWSLEDYSKLEQYKPAVIFLEEDNILYFSDVSKLPIALDPGGMKMKYAFYSDAKNDDIKGYILLDESPFGKAFARQDIYTTYLAP